MYIEKYPWMPIDDDRGRPRSVPDRPIRPSPSRLKMTAPFPSYHRTDGVWPSRPVLSNFGRTGRLITLIAILPSELVPPAIHHDICLAEHVPDETPDPHERSERHVNACIARDLCCNDCSGVFLTVEGLWSHDCQLPSQDPSAPGHYPCRNCPQAFPTVQLLNMHNRFCIPVFRPFPYFCMACNIDIVPENVAIHRSLEEHIKKSKSKGLYCYLLS